MVKLAKFYPGKKFLHIIMVPGLPSEEGSGGVGLDGWGLGAVVSPISLQRLLTSVM